jgi:hypothetical protein
MLIFLICVTQLFAQGSIVKYRKDGTLLVNGKPTIVYGAFRDPSDNWRKFDGLKEAGFNLTHSYHFESRGYKEGVDRWIKDACEYLDLAEKAGVGVFLGIPHEVFWRLKLDELKKMISAVKDKPALWFWYMMDEPMMHVNKWIKKGVLKSEEDAIKVVQKVYETIKSADPNHPAVMVVTKKFLKKPATGKYCDALWPDVYQHRYSTLGIKWRLDELHELYPGKPCLAIIHGATTLPYIYKKDKDYEFPKKLTVTDKTIGNNPKVLRANVNSSIAGGSQGVIFYWAPRYQHNLLANTPGNWKAMCEIGKTLKSMSNIILDGDKKAGVEMTVHQWGHLERQMSLTGKIPSKKVREEFPTVAMWQRKYKGAIYIGLSSNFVPVQKVFLTLPSKFKKVSFMPGGETVIEMKADGKHKVDYKKLPVTLWGLAEKKIIIILQDADSLMLKFE